MRARGQYGRAFVHVESDGGDLTYFVAHSLRVVELALHDLQLYLERKQEQKMAPSLPGIEGLNARQKALLEHALAHPKARYSFALHQNLHGVVYQTARSDLLGLEERGFLQREIEGKKFVFAPVASRFVAR